MVDWRDNENFDHMSAFHDKVGMILGGMPTSEDVAPSAIFVVGYALLIVPIIFRIKTHTITFGQLWKPFFLVLMRIITFALRIELATDSVWNKHIFITELIFLRLGPIILTLALLQHFSNALLPYIPTIDAPNLPIKVLLKYFVLFLTVLTHFCLGLTIAVAFDVKQAINGDAQARVKLHRSKEISIWLLCAIHASVYVLSIVPFVLRQQGLYTSHLVVSLARERTKFISIIAVCTFMMVVSGFKAAQLAAHGLSSHYVTVINQKVLFYTVCCTGEYVACALLLSLAWARIAPPAELLEAYCRMHKTHNNSPLNQWPGPPAPTVAARNDMMQSTLPSTRPASIVDERGAYYDPEIARSAVRQAKVVSIVDHGGAQQHHINAGETGVFVNDDNWSDVNLAAEVVAKPIAALTCTTEQDNAGSVSTSAKQRGSRRTSPNSLSTISEDTVEKDHHDATASSTSNDRYNTCSPGSTIRGDMHGRSSSVDSLALPANLIPFHPDPKAVSIATSRLPRLSTTPTSTRTEIKPFDNASMASTTNSDAQRQHQPLTMIRTSALHTDSGRRASEPQIRTSLRSSSVPDSQGTTDAVVGTRVSDGIARQATSTNNNVSDISDELLATSCSVQSRWSEDSDDDRPHSQNSSNSTHGRFHHHHHHHHLHRQRRPLPAEAWDHEDVEADHRTSVTSTAFA